MIIDSSAIVAVIFKELDHQFYSDRLLSASSKRMSAVSLVETSVVIRSKKGAAGIELLRELIAESRIEIVAFTAHQAELSLIAYQRFGKGMGHPAQLNVLDCCSYALAAESGEPLLFKGGDFSKTDIGLVR